MFICLFFLHFIFFHMHICIAYYRLLRFFRRHRRRHHFSLSHCKRRRAIAIINTLSYFYYGVQNPWAHAIVRLLDTRFTYTHTRTQPVECARCYRRADARDIELCSFMPRRDYAIYTPIFFLPSLLAML